MASIFTRIIKGEIPCYKVAETKECLAFLDINPIKVGHTLCIPKKEVDYLFDLDEDHYIKLMTFSAKVARAIDLTIPCERVGVAVIGLEVPHAHVHLIPIDGIHDIDFSKPKKIVRADEFEKIAADILSAFNKL